MKTLLIGHCGLAFGQTDTTNPNHIQTLESGGTNYGKKYLPSFDFYRITENHTLDKINSITNLSGPRHIHTYLDPYTGSTRVAIGGAFRATVLYWSGVDFNPFHNKRSFTTNEFTVSHFDSEFWNGYLRLSIVGANYLTIPASSFLVDGISVHPSEPAISSGRYLGIATLTSHENQYGSTSVFFDGAIDPFPVNTFSNDNNTYDTKVFFHNFSVRDFTTSPADSDMYSFNFITKTQAGRLFYYSPKGSAVSQETEDSLADNTSLSSLTYESLNPVPGGDFYPRVTKFRHPDDDIRGIFIAQAGGYAVHYLNDLGLSVFSNDRVDYVDSRFDIDKNLPVAVSTFISQNKAYIVMLCYSYENDVPVSGTNNNKYGTVLKLVTYEISSIDGSLLPGSPINDNCVVPINGNTLSPSQFNSNLGVDNIEFFIKARTFSDGNVMVAVYRIARFDNIDNAVANAEDLDNYDLQVNYKDDDLWLYQAENLTGNIQYRLVTSGQYGPIGVGAVDLNDMIVDSTINI